MALFWRVKAYDAMCGVGTCEHGIHLTRKSAEKCRARIATEFHAEVIGWPGQKDEE